MINIDFLTLKAFFAENIDFIIGARIQKIQQPTRRDFIFSLRNNGESRRLYININPEIYHICFMSPKNEEKRELKIPKQPPMFCMLLRKYLEGSKISDGCVVENERIFELHFDLYDEFEQPRSLCLCVELMGKHSNVILYDRETKFIIGCAHNVGPEKSRYRELQGGLLYKYPPVSKFRLSDELKQQFSTLSEAEIASYLNTNEYRPAIKDDRYTLFSELIEGSEIQSDVNTMLDNYYSKHQIDIKLSSYKSKLTNAVKLKLEKNINKSNKIEKLFEKSKNSEKYKIYGELLLANSYIKEDYKKQVELFDYYNNCNISIELDDTKTMSENAQKYFRLYAKSKAAKLKNEEILSELKVECEYLENVLYSINVASNLSEISEIEAELGMSDVVPKRTQNPMVPKIVINGFDVYIGKNCRQNDYIISKLSRDEDLWFHTKQCAGSHVLLKVKEVQPDDETILECCKLARENSSAGKPSKVPVIYTKRKFIKKTPAAPLGYVIYKNEKEILI